jgi:hypothetical protein
MSAQVPKRSLVAIVLCVFVVAALPGCGRGRIKEVPPEMLGVWYTDAPGYQGRWMELRTDEIVFATGPNTSTTHHVNGLRRREERGHVDYSIYYDNEEGQEYELVITYEYEEGGRILFQNQKNMVWRRRSPGRE